MATVMYLHGWHLFYQHNWSPQDHLLPGCWGSYGRQELLHGVLGGEGLHGAALLLLWLAEAALLLLHWHQAEGLCRGTTGERWSD